MSSRRDITGPDQVIDINEFIKYGLVYTDNLGWIDLGHANPEGALSLWRQMINPHYTEGDFFRVAYRQSMSRKLIRGFGLTKLTTSVSKEYYVKRGLHIDQLMGIAYAIFLNTSYDFESLQNRFPFNMITDSGFSVEDLISNIIGFHSAVHSTNYLEKLKIKESSYAFKIWDFYGPVGGYKNNELKPMLFPDPEDDTVPHEPYKIPLPDFLSRIKPISDKRFVREIFY
ncbi:hypothetical protein [Enterobacillus tribolii]|uniref:Uncharacterized protein n=1 Tax=Enterobacillus tribolii TaxID=1487935 RepID=A0A370QSE2_9GAMM|nr:hypothetical protein [Enterobacillus tribolii]MBW7983770.1 hypothetical protein [Enterobacillus tribolii]RDK92135.1 hypothetical protein C8D90_104293 [Enterobacillus tribolii]